MSYKLNNNLLFAALVACFVLSSVKVQAQATVTLVVDEDSNLSDNELPAKDELNEADASNANTPANDVKADSLITPPVETPSESSSEEAAPAEADETFSLDLSTTETPVPANDEPTDEVAPAPVATTPSALTAPATPLTATTPSATTEGASATPAATVEPLPKSEPEFGDALLSKIDNDLFNQMSDIEKQTTLLTLELRREKLRNELEAVKEQRIKAYEEKLAAEEEKKRKQLEWEKEQEAKVLREQQALKEKEIILEKLKQRKALNEYMNQMLAQNQRWIAENSKLYKKMREVENDRRRVTDDFKGKLDNLKILAEKYVQTSTDVKSSYDRTVANLTAQIAQIKKRLEAEELAAKNRAENPFADSGENGENSGNGGSSQLSGIDLQIAPISLAKEYAILEISGQGDDLSAKLINKDGQSFSVRVGTTLQTGHVVERINKNSIQFDKDGLKDYLYTSVSATGIEPEAFVETPQDMISPVKAPAKKAVAKPTVNKKQGLLSTTGMMSLGKGMFVK